MSLLAQRSPSLTIPLATVHYTWQPWLWPSVTLLHTLPHHVRFFVGFWGVFLPIISSCRHFLQSLVVLRKCNLVKGHLHKRENGRLISVVGGRVIMRRKEFMSVPKQCKVYRQKKKTFIPEQCLCRNTELHKQQLLQHYNYTAIVLPVNFLTWTNPQFFTCKVSPIILILDYLHEFLAFF